MRILPMIILCTGVAMIGAAGIGYDYTTQKQKADGPYTTATYVDGFFDRFGNDGGFLGLIFRDSAAIDEAMPDAPTGWDAWYIDGSHWSAVFSDEQWLVREREFAKIEAQVPELNELSETDNRLWTEYFNDTSTAYTRGDNVILMFISDDENAVNQPVLRKFEQLAEAHFETIETRKDWRNFNGQQWQEVKGPVSQTENGFRPHKLQMFETEMGSVSIFLETRASEEALIQFLEGFDVSGLRKLGSADMLKSAALAAD